MRASVVARQVQQQQPARMRKPQRAQTPVQFVAPDMGYLVQRFGELFVLWFQNSLRPNS
jgi:hypothetical protein